MKAVAGVHLSIIFASLVAFAAPVLAAAASSPPGSDEAVKIGPPRPASAAVDAGTVSGRSPARSASRLPVLGVALDVGLPDGANLSLVARPWPWSRVQLGMGSNGMSYGWRAGVTLLPFREGPAAVVEYGHYQDGNANDVAGALIGSSFHKSPLFDHVGYDYVNLHLGLNFGYRRVVFFVQAGLSIVRGHIDNASQAVGQATSGSGTEVTVHSDPTVKATGFAGKLGLIAYVW